ALATLLAAFGCGGSDTPTSTTDTRPAVVASVRELGTVGRPPTVSVRDGGATGLVGGRLLWLFGDTIFNPRSVDGENLRTCTAALATPGQPLATSEPTDANGAPAACFAFTSEE